LLRDNLAMATDNYLLEWRKRADLSQDRLAEAMTDIAAAWPMRDGQQTPRKWGRTDVLKVEKGKRAADTDFLRAAAAVLRCSVTDLLERRPDQPLPVPTEIRALVSTWRKIPDTNKDRALKVLNQFADD